MPGPHRSRGLIPHSTTQRKSVCRTADIHSRINEAYVQHRWEPHGRSVPPLTRASEKWRNFTMGPEQKVAVITGASQGIGAALVKAYLDRNYRVVATARSVKPTSNADILVVPGDIADRKTAERAISEGLGRFRRIDTLVNNAGIFIAKPFTQYTEVDFATILNVNIAGFFHITQLAVAEMEKQGSGHVVQITTSLVDHAIAGVPSVLAS